MTVLGSCGNETVYGNDGMLEYAREYFGNDELTIGGTSYGAGETLVWFDGNIKIAERAEAASFRNAQDGGYEFLTDLDAAKEASRVWSCRWQNGVAFHIENPDCTSFTVSSGDYSMTATFAETPFNFFFPLRNSPDYSVKFYNKKGTEL